jgi:hypothetical protein
VSKISTFTIRAVARAPGHLPANDTLSRRWLAWAVKRTAAWLGL